MSKQPRTPPVERREGRITYINSSFGFIRDSKLEIEYFFSKVEKPTEDFDSLFTGDKVTYSPVNMRATNIVRKSHAAHSHHRRASNPMRQEARQLKAKGKSTGSSSSRGSKNRAKR